MTTQTHGPEGAIAERDTAAATDRTELTVEGMHCASCARRVERTLAGQDGVTAANVNLASARATVRYDPSSVSIEALRESIEKIGYGLAGPSQAPEDGDDAAAGNAAPGCGTRWGPGRSPGP